MTATQPLHSGRYSAGRFVPDGICINPSALRKAFLTRRHLSRRVSSFVSPEAVAPRRR